MANLFRYLKEDEIEVRTMQIDKDGKWVICLLYKDARCDMNILDETVGPYKWKREHNRDNANCVVSIWADELKQWVGKEDTGTESNTEAAKGLASDSFKRACFNWGIGRELYTSPFIIISLQPTETYEYKDKRYLDKKVKFHLRHIKSEDGKIIELGINDQDDKKRYTWIAKKENTNV